MTVQELIEELNRFPHDAKVELYDPVEDICTDIDKIWFETGIVTIYMELV
jgi:hypothetical protein